MKGPNKEGLKGSLWGQATYRLPKTSSDSNIKPRVNLVLVLICLVLSASVSDFSFDSDEEAKEESLNFNMGTRTYEPLNPPNLWSLSEDTSQKATYKLTQIQPQAINGNLVANVSTTKSLRWASHSFFAANRYWLFYTDVYSGNPNAGIGLETSSLDTVTWTTPTVITAPYMLVHPYGTCLEVLLDDNGLIHTIMRARSIDSITSRADIFYRVGQPFVNGTIGWLTDWQDFWNGQRTTADPFMALDSEGYPWASWSTGPDLANVYPYVMKSDMNNGTWHTAEGYPIQLSSAPYTTNSFLVPLSNIQMMTLYFSAPGTIYSRLIDANNTMGSEETVTSSNIWAEYPFGRESWARSAVTDTNDNILLVFVSDSMSIQFTQRINATGSWIPETTIQTNVINSVNPSLIVYGDLLQCFWVYDNNSIVFKVFGDGVWDSKETIAVQDFSSFIPDIDEFGFSGVMSSFIQYTQAGSGLYWIMNTSNPQVYQIRFLDFCPPNCNLACSPTETAIIVEAPSSDSTSKILTMAAVAFAIMFVSLVIFLRRKHSHIYSHIKLYA
jgi:hypothetical protein